MHQLNLISLVRINLSYTLCGTSSKNSAMKRNIPHVKVKNIHMFSKRLTSSKVPLCPWKRAYNSIIEAKNAESAANDNDKQRIKSGPGLQYFLKKHQRVLTIPKVEEVPYVKKVDGNNQKVYLDIHGCQMNVSDAAVIWTILVNNGYQIVSDSGLADIILIITCAIREKAEDKIWHQLNKLSAIKQKLKVEDNRSLKIGVLGCMAERLKHVIIEQKKCVDIVAGPDSYKDLPRLLSVSDNETAINVALSLDETYADIRPARLNPDSVTAFVTIMRGCDNMCTYCIVPFTRGREKSRPMKTILEEIKWLSDQGVKEVTLLGQNVNSYRDTSTSIFIDTKTRLANGFTTVYKNKTGGLRFGDLLEKVSVINPEMRIRFTSPHPKDFPDDVLRLIAEKPNICKQLHVPAQSGNSRVLERMRRGYTREAYVDLILYIRSVIPDISLSSDFIAGFCGETEEEFEDTLSLIEEVKYNVAYLFAYSMREKTTAHRRYQDDVPQDVKIARLQRMIDLYRAGATKLNRAQIGQQHLVLVEGPSKKSSNDLQGRTDGNIKVIFPCSPIVTDKEDQTFTREIRPGDYIVVQIYEANSQGLKGVPLYHTTLTSYNQTQSGARKQAYPMKI